MYKLYLFDEYKQVTEEFIIRALQFLPENRRNRALRYRKATDRINCVITYLMLRYGLRECFGITSFKIELGKYGKPFLADYPNVHFSISHCDIGNAVVVANFPIGVDIQEVRPFSWNVAKRVCSGQELAELEKCANQDKLFTRMWTAKESYAKMIGQGVLYAFSSINTNNLSLDTTILEMNDYFVAVSGQMINVSEEYTIKKLSLPILNGFLYYSCNQNQ